MWKTFLHQITCFADPIIAHNTFGCTLSRYQIVPTPFVSLYHHKAHQHFAFYHNILGGHSKPISIHKLVDDRPSSHFNFCLSARSLPTPVPFEFSSKANISQQDGQQNGWLYENLDLTYVIIEITRELPHNNFYKIISKTKKAYIQSRDVRLLG